MQATTSGNVEIVGAAISSIRTMSYDPTCSGPLITAGIAQRLMVGTLRQGSTGEMQSSVVANAVDIVMVSS
jgi:hypothetical protein